jgi:ApaG protein
MQTAITRGVKVSVETFYQLDYSNPLKSEYMFAYRITIINQSEQTLQLLSRHWNIIDANGIEKQIEGEGVIGHQPILRPNESYQYVSGCNLNTEIGKMFGTYTMINIGNGKKFNVNIPIFHLVATQKLN